METYHFYRIEPGQTPKWWSSRKNLNGLMYEWIYDLSQRYDVVRAEGVSNSWLIRDKT